MLTPKGPPPVTFEPWSLLKQWRRMQRDPLLRVRERFELYGDVYRIQFLGRTRYVMRHPRDLQQVLIDQAASFDKPSSGPAARQLRRFLGEGLLTSNGEPWRRQRRLIQPAFHREHLEGYAEVVTAHTGARLDTMDDGAALDISPLMMSLTLGIVNKALFDLDLSTQTERIAHAIDTFRHTFDGPSAILPSFVPSRARGRLKRAISDLDAMLFGLLDAPRTETQTDLLSTLARAAAMDPQNRMTRKQMRDELVTLLVAGHETTSHTLSWTFHLLSEHPEVEARLHAEVDHVLSGRVPTFSDLPLLPYTAQVLSEALRLYPPAYVVLRTANKAAQVGEYAIPKGTDLVLWIYHTHHDSRWHDLPERFDPERFSKGRRRALVPCSYLPFGAGQRTCIGKQFALMEAQLVLAMFAQRISLEKRAGARLRADVAVTLAPRGLTLTVRTRKPSGVSTCASGVPQTR